MSKQAPRAGASRSLPLLVALTVACGGADSSRIVESGWQVEEALRIGRVDGDGPDLFGVVRALEVDGEGRLWVLDQQAKELRVFDARGSHVRTVGREGGGPGEFVYPLGLAWDPQGRLMVADPRNTRISVFDTSGAFVMSHPMQGGFTVNPSPARVDTAGNFYNFAPDMSVPGWRVVMVRYDSAMRPVDTLVPPGNPITPEYFEYVSPDGNDRGRTPVPFTPRMLWRLSPTGDFWAALTGSYTLVRLSGRGDTLARIAHAYDPVPVTTADVDSVLEDLTEFRQLGGHVDPARIPSHKPAIENFWVGDDGRVWVAITTADPAMTRRVFDVFAADGTYEGRAVFPFAIVPTAIPIFRRDRVYAVTQDAHAVPYVVVGTIGKAS